MYPVLLSRLKERLFFLPFENVFFSSVAVAVVVVCLMEDLVATHHNFAVDLCNATDKASVERPTVAPPESGAKHTDCLVHPVDALHAVS